MLKDTPASAHTQRNLLAYVLMLVVGVLLLIIAYQMVKDGFWYFIFKELGFALIVAVFLVGTIERFSRERHEAAAQESVASINRNLFYAIFKRYIPEKVFEEVENSVMEANVFRTKHELDYTIQDYEGDFVTCLAQTSYDLTSVVDAPIDHEIVVRLELPIDARYVSKCEIIQVKIGSSLLSALELANGIDRDHEHCTLRFKTRIEGRATISISTKSQLIKKTTDVEVWASRIPSDGLKLTVSTPGGNLEVCATANHSQQLENKISNTVTKKWDLPYGIFPFQSIMFWWKPRTLASLNDRKGTQGMREFPHQG